MPGDFEILFPRQVTSMLATIEPVEILDIFLVAMLFYKLYDMVQNTRAATLVKGVVVFLVVTVICSLLELRLMTWLLQSAIPLFFIVLPIVFQPELRRALEHLGQGRFLQSSVFLDADAADAVTREIVKAMVVLSKEKTGALVVIEREIRLDDIATSGIHIDGLIKSEFLLNVFIVGTPLHDGATIIRGNRLVASACYLPLTDNRSLSTELGTRHRAAIGLSEQCDALIVVVSEETGIISVAENGKLTRNLDEESLYAKLLPAFVDDNAGLFETIKNWRHNGR
ncbi:MAG: diadenylate cyclase CdaA [Selenomonadaceae bacterium]|nr:diadenylate cyclase CdaA [Selenomonadaceae bacterium]